MKLSKAKQIALWKADKLAEIQAELADATEAAKVQYEAQRWLLEHDFCHEYPEFLFTEGGKCITYRYGETFTKADKAEIRAALKEFPFEWELDDVKIPAYAP